LATMTMMGMHRPRRVPAADEICLAERG